MIHFLQLRNSYGVRGRPLVSVWACKSLGLRFSICSSEAPGEGSHEASAPGQAAPRCPRLFPAYDPFSPAFRSYRTGSTSRTSLTVMWWRVGQAFRSLEQNPLVAPGALRLTGRARRLPRQQYIYSTRVRFFRSALPRKKREQELAATSYPSPPPSSCRWGMHGNPRWHLCPEYVISWSGNTVAALSTYTHPA